MNKQLQRKLKNLASTTNLDDLTPDEFANKVMAIVSDTAPKAETLPHLCIACGKEHFGCCGSCEFYEPIKVTKPVSD